MFEVLLPITSKTEKVLKGYQGEKSSKDIASSRYLVSATGAQASSKKTGTEPDVCKRMIK